MLESYLSPPLHSKPLLYLPQKYILRSQKSSHVLKILESGEVLDYYQKLRCFSLFNSYFGFLDTEDYLAQGLFVKHQVKVKLCEVHVHHSIPYKILVCRVRRKDEAKIIAALNELASKMLICGYRDYLECCSGFWTEMEKIKSGAKEVPIDADYTPIQTK